MTVSIFQLPALLALGLLFVACGDEELCDAASLQAALDSAASGTIVVAGACTITGSVRVPPGIELAGAGAATTIALSDSESRVTIETGGALRGLTVQSDGCAGVVAQSADDVSITDVAITATTGVGLAVEGGTNLRVSNVTVTGPVTLAGAETTVPPSAPFTCGSSTLATHGVVLVDAMSADLDNLQIDGFAAFGFLAIRSDLTWSAGGVGHNLGTGLEVWGGQATLTNLVLADTTDGTGAIESFGGAFGGGAVITSDGLVVEDGDSFGLFHDGVSASHQNVTARNNGFAGLWAQTSTSFEVGGSTMLANNGFAGLALIGTVGVDVSNATIRDTSERVRIEGVSTVRAADGVLLENSDGSLADLTLIENPRAGLVLDLATGESSRVTLENISVDATGAALGAVAQNGTILPGWDDEVARMGATVANDGAFSGALEVAGAIGPVCFPPIDSVETGGIAGLIAP